MPKMNLIETGTREHIRTPVFPNAMVSPGHPWDKWSWWNKIWRCHHRLSLLNRWLAILESPNMKFIDQKAKEFQALAELWIIAIELTHLEFIEKLIFVVYDLL